MMGVPRILRGLGCLTTIVLLTACSNGRGSLDDQPQSPQTPPPSAPAETSLTIGGTITGLTGSGLVLQNNAGADLPVATDGSFTFPTAAATGTAYSVTVLTQPTSPAQTCTVANGAGTLASTNVTSIAVTCSAEPRYFVGGTVIGLTGAGLVLQNNNVDDLVVNANGPFKFAAALASNANYSVTVRTHPPGQNCAVKNAVGVTAAADVPNIEVSCAANQFTLGGTISGLRGAGLTLLVNGGDALKVINDGPFAFPTALTTGTAYEVKVGAQPGNPTQECTLANATGAIARANVTGVVVTCVTRRFTVGGNVTGLAGAGLTLRLNGTADLTIQSNGAFTFPTGLLSGTSYTVTVPSTPSTPLQQCTATMANGTVRGSNITDVQVACATQTFAVGGSVTGLLGSGLTLLNNRGDSIPVNSNTTFEFPTKLASGSAYEVQVGASPSNPTQACSVTNASGTLTNADRRDVLIACSTSNFSIGGTIENLSGTVILRNNGADDLTLSASGPFTFATAIPSGTPYAVSVAQQPLGQTCNITAFGGGTVTTSNIANVKIECIKTAFTVGGRVYGLLGPSLVLQNNGADNLEIAADGPFTFPTPLPVNTPYSVTVATTPTTPAQSCGILNGDGVIAGSDVQHVDVYCFLTGL
jgi:hypothetical protein